MKKIIFFFIIIFFVLVAFTSYYFWYDNFDKVCFKSKCYAVELALTEAERAVGLMDRNNLDSDKGMLFIFEREDMHPFWMKNTLISLDIIWINKDKKIVYIYKNAQPCKAEKCPNIIPPNKAQYVLELNAGEADKLELEESDELKFVAH